LDAAAGDGDDRAHVPLEEPGKVTFQERFDAGAGEAHGGEEAAWGFGHPWCGASRARLRHHRRGDEGAPAGEVEGLGELPPRPAAPGRRHDGVGQLQGPECGPDPVAQWEPLSETLRTRGAPSASNGIVPRSPHLTRSPRSTGPSAQARIMRVTPSSPWTGSMHVMHTPMPHAPVCCRNSSTDTWEGRPKSPATCVTDRSRSVGPHP